MSGWNVIPIKQLGRVVTGKTPPTGSAEYYGGNELFVSPKDLTRDSCFVSETETQISIRALEKFKGQVIPKNSVMFTSLSFAFGKMGITTRPCITNQQINTVVPNEEHNYRFVYYLLRTYEPIIFSYNSGIDTPIVPKSVFEKIQIRCPDLALQKKIAAVLAAYDDLIENNRRRVELLERMAAELYREWFVRFRFPGHQQAKFHKGLPAEWELKKLKDILELCYGKALKEEQRQPGDFPVYGSSGVVGSHNKPLVDGPGIIIGRKGNVGSIHWSDTGFFPIDTAYFVKAKISLHYVFFMLGGLNFINNDSAVPGLNREQAYSNPVLLPPATLIEKFKGIVISYFAEKQSILKRNEVLSEMRDQLLTRLISGRLTVDQLDIQFPPSMREAAEARQEVAHA